jgi:lipopolysaccharide export system protein LptA
MKKTIARLILLILLQLTSSGQLLAQDSTVAPGAFASDQPIEIVADRLEGDQHLGNVKFFGNVAAKQGDVTIYAEEFDIYYQPDSREMEKIIARTGVRIVQGERIATAELAVYYNQQGKIVLTGSPKVHQGQDLVAGDEITVFLNEERSVVTGKEGGRVNAVFHPQGEKP